MKRKKQEGKDVIPVSEFKAKCLKLFDETGKKGREYTITKNGEPIAHVIPIKSKKKAVKSLRGAWKGMAEIHGDIVHFNLSEDWEAAQQ